MGRIGLMCLLSLDLRHKKMSNKPEDFIAHFLSPLRCGRDSNSRPHAWQACILTSWTTAPTFVLRCCPYLRVQRYTKLFILARDSKKKVALFFPFPAFLLISSRLLIQLFLHTSLFVALAFPFHQPLIRNKYAVNPKIRHFSLVFFSSSEYISYLCAWMSDQCPANGKQSVRIYLKYNIQPWNLSLSFAFPCWHQ